MNKVASSALIVEEQIHGLSWMAFCGNTTAGVGEQMCTPLAGSRHTGTGRLRTT